MGALSLKRAREKRDDTRKLVAAEGDLSAKRQTARTAQADTFQAIGTEWLDLQRVMLVAGTISIPEARLNTYVPVVGESSDFSDCGARVIWCASPDRGAREQ